MAEKACHVVASTAQVGLIQALDVLTNRLHLLIVLFITTLLTSAAGCSRQAATLAPEIVGTLTIDGQPAKDAEVVVGFSGDHEAPCKGLEPAATVGGDGNFHVLARTAQLSDQDIAAIPYGTTQNYVCFRYLGQVFVDSMFLTKPTDREILRAECFSPRPGRGYDDGLCRWTRITSNNSFKPNPLRGSA